MIDRNEINFLKKEGYYSFPQIIQIEITKACPFSCKQCYKPRLESEYMNYAKLCAFLNYISGKCPEISLNGGEPLVYPHIYDLLYKIKEMNFNTYLYSSGYGVNDELCSIIDNNKNLHFYISLNGSTAEINNRSRDGYSYAIRAIETMTERNIDFNLIWVARHDNIDDFENIIRLAFYYNIPYISIISNRLTGVGIIDSPLTKNDLSKLASIIKNKELKKPYIMVDNCFSDLILELGYFIKGLPMRCVAGVSRCTVNYDFSFQPCTHLCYQEKYKIIDEYWNSSKILNEIRFHNYKNGGLCNKCSNNKKCYPCRATNIELYKNLEGYVSSCINYKE